MPEGKCMTNFPLKWNFCEYNPDTTHGGNGAEPMTTAVMMMLVISACNEHCNAVVLIMITIIEVMIHRPCHFQMRPVHLCMCSLTH